MERKKSRRAIELLKDLAILLLACSAVYLLGRAQLYTGDDWLTGVRALFPGRTGSQAVQPVGDWGQGGVMRPVRIAVTSPQGIFAVQYDSAKTAEVFSTLANPLSDALAGAQAPQRIGAKEWRAVLSGETTGIYLDFLGSIPLADLSSWLSGGREPNASLTGTARRIFLTVDGGGYAVLYYINENDGLYYACETTADLTGRLEGLLDVNTLSSVRFAFQDKAYSGLAPYTLLGVEAPRPKVYAASDPVPLPADLQTGGDPVFEGFVRSVSFHPQSYSTYPTTDGIGVQEGADTLRISRSGVVTYKAAEEDVPRYAISSAGAQPQLWEIVDGAWAFVEKTVGPLCGEAQLYLMDTEAVDGGIAVVFGYQLGGAAVHVGQEGYAARVVVKNGAITDFTFQLRSYADTGETSIVLPEAKAMAAMGALDAQGSELLLCYVDRGDERVTAGWIAQKP